jgi:hypothetical protein
MAISQMFATLSHKLPVSQGLSRAFGKAGRLGGCPKGTPAYPGDKFRLDIGQ